MIQDFYEKFALVEKRTVPDNMGGFTLEYVDGAVFEGGLTTDNSIEMRVAEKQGVTSIYTFTTRKDIPLQYGDIFKRIADKAYFRVTSNPDDYMTPRMSQLNFKQAQAERWTIENK